MPAPPAAAELMESLERGNRHLRTPSRDERPKFRTAGLRCRPQPAHGEAHEQDAHTMDGVLADEVTRPVLGREVKSRAIRLRRDPSLAPESVHKEPACRSEYLRVPFRLGQTGRHDDPPEF